MARYAEGTSVAPEKSQQEIVTMLRRYGARKIATGWDDDRALVGFEAHERQIRFVLHLPPVANFTRTEAGRTRSSDAAATAREAEVRRRWRALNLAIKAKLEVVATGISEFESEFLAYVVLPDGRTVADHTRPAIQDAYATGRVPEMLPKAIGAGA
jgi:hypothetical protein